MELNLPPSYLKELTYSQDMEERDRVQEKYGIDNKQLNNAIEGAADEDLKAYCNNCAHNLNGWGSLCDDCIPERLSWRAWGESDEDESSWSPWMDNS